MSAFRIVHNPNRHPPYGTYYVYRGAKFVGSQVSYPTESDCNHMANPPNPIVRDKAFVFSLGPRRGRPTNEELARRRIAEKFEEDAWV